MPHLPPSHADHDPLAIAAYAAGDATGPELDDALALVAACGDCAALHHDLRAIAAALPDLPAPVRTRDFRLAPEQAASLRPAGWRRVLAPFAGPRFAFAGPLGAGLATLGLAGFLVAGSFGVPLAASAPATGGASAAASDAAATGTADANAVEMAPQLAPASAPAASTAPVELRVPNTAIASPITSLVPAAGGDIAGEAPSGDPKMTSVGSGVNDSEASPDAASRMSAADQPLSPEPVNDGNALAPLAPLAALLLVVGVVLGGVRLIARRMV
jgi:hypothetical protein